MPSICQSRRTTSGLASRSDGPGAFAVIRFVNLDDAERLQNRDHQLSHMLVVIDYKDFQSVEAIAAHAPVHTLGPARTSATMQDT